MITVAMVVAHPDDDTLGISRSIALHAGDRRLRFVLVHATDGEAGEVAPDVAVPPEGLGALRRKEDAESWRVLGRRPDRHEWLGFPDGGLAALPRELLVDRVWAVLSDESPDVVATFGPDGITGHPDHIAIGAATTAAFLRGVDTGRPGFRRLLHAAIRQTDIERWNANRTAMGIFPWDGRVIYHLRGVPDDTIGVTVDTRSVAPRAVAALRAHRSQWSPSLMAVDDDIMVRSLRSEDWVIAWPRRQPGEAVHGDVLEGL